LPSSVGRPHGNWYVHRDAYWAPADQAGEYPVRQGDLFGDVQVAAGESWDAALIVHPTCELSKKAVARVQVARVRPLSALPDDSQRAAVQAGFRERDGRLAVAFAHTFFVAPVAGSSLDRPMWADLRDIGLADREQFSAEQRVGSLTHDARVTFIRRYLYFRFRLALGFTEIRELEAARIAADPAFHGPTPDWAI
jgi:hypothetical protein